MGLSPTVVFLAGLVVADAFNWIAGGRGKGACSGAAVQDPPAVVASGMDISFYTAHTSSKSCMYRTADQSINLRTTPRMEVDVHTSGNGQREWFSLWLDPINYKQPPQESGEIDLVEPTNGMVYTNFAACSHNCYQESWGVPNHMVNHHISMFYDASSNRENVHHCQYGASTCGSGGGGAWIDLSHFGTASNPEYVFVADIWYAEPSAQFEFHVKNLRMYGSGVDEAVV